MLGKISIARDGFWWKLAHYEGIRSWAKDKRSFATDSCSLINQSIVSVLMVLGEFWAALSAALYICMVAAFIAVWVASGYFPIDAGAGIVAAGLYSVFGGWPGLVLMGPAFVAYLLTPVALILGTFVLVAYGIVELNEWLESRKPERPDLFNQYWEVRKGYDSFEDWYDMTQRGLFSRNFAIQRGLFSRNFAILKKLILAKADKYCLPIEWTEHTAEEVVEEKKEQV